MIDGGSAKRAMMVSYVIRLKANANLKKLADELHPTGTPADITQTESFVEETIYQAGSWAKPRIIIIQSVRQDGEIFFNHDYFVTNMGHAFYHHSIVHRYTIRREHHM